MSVAERIECTGPRKAAVLLSIVGVEEAASILRNLPEDDLETIAEELVNLPPVPVETTLEILEEYRQMMSSREFVTVGGQDVATRMLGKAIGTESAMTLVQRVTHGPDEATATLDVLKKTDPQQLARFLAGEQAQTLALILGHLEAKQASTLLMNLDPGVRAECVRRLATMGKFSPAAVAKASKVLARRFGSLVDQSRQANSGIKNLAEMMNCLDPSAAREILQTIEAEEPQIAISIRDRMFTFENFLEVPEQDLRELAGAIDKKTLVIALKAASEDLRAHFYRTMSSRAVELMKEDSEMMGPVRGKDAIKAQGEIVAIARKLEAEGKIALQSEGEDEYVL